MHTPDVATLTLLEKTAHNNGFNLPLEASPPWLGFASSKAPLRVWLGELEDKRFVLALSQSNVDGALGHEGEPAPVTLPDGAIAARAAPTLVALGRLLKRAFLLSRALPNALLHDFENEAKEEAGVEDLAALSEKQRVVVERVGQRVFRRGLVDYWQGKCAITGVALSPLLVASHIKPWSQCTTYAERLDAYNGLLLAVHYDKVFDKGWMTVENDGSLVWSSFLNDDARARLGFLDSHRVGGLTDAHRKYLEWHRAKVFKPDAQAPVLTSQEGASFVDG